MGEQLREMKIITADSAHEILQDITNALNIQPGKIMQALRLALTGGASGPDLMITMEILGPQEVASRIAFAIDSLNGKVS